MLFSNARFAVNDVPAAAKAASVLSATGNRFVSDQRLTVLENTIGTLQPGQSIYFKTNGAWSNIDLVEYILMQAGPAEVLFTTWSISADAIAKFSDWQASGMISSLHVILDAGIRNRKPEIYQQATGAFGRLRITHCHAKVTVIISNTHCVTLMGSANYTRNPRIETGVICYEEDTANAHKNWIKEEFESD